MIAVANFTAEHDTVFFFQTVFGPRFTAETCPKTAETFAEVTVQVRAIYTPLKAHFQRERPYDKYPDQIFPCAVLNTNFSYPSGHTTRGMVLGRLLSDLIPERAHALMDKGLRLGYFRAVAGLHYPTDIDAGQRLGNAVAEAIIASDAWQQRREALRAEIRAVMLPSNPVTARVAPAE